MSPSASTLAQDIRRGQVSLSRKGLSSSAPPFVPSSCPEWRPQTVPILSISELVDVKVTLTSTDAHTPIIFRADQRLTCIRQFADHILTGRNIPVKLPTDRFTIVGPHPPYYMELTSSEGGSTDSALDAQSPRGKEHNHYPSAANDSPQCKRSISPIFSEPIDWIAYSEQGGPLSHSTLISHGSDGASEWSLNDAETPIVITPNSSSATRQETLIIGDLGVLLNQPRSHTRPPTPDNKRINATPPLNSVTSPNKRCQPIGIISRADPARPKDTQSGRPVRLQSDLAQVLLESGGGGDDHKCIGTLSENDAHPTAVQSPVRPPLHTICAACGRTVQNHIAKRMIPCGVRNDTICSPCFSSSLAAVSMTQGQSHCPACLKVVSTFERLPRDPPADDYETGLDLSPKRVDARSHKEAQYYETRPAAMRIDNVAWDVTAEVVEAFLPPDTLSRESGQAIHIPINRFDGRTKDYLVVASPEAAKSILKTRQNTFIPGGPLTCGKKRPVTITPVTHPELLSELRPQSPQELYALLNLCQITIGPPSSSTRFLKSRHAPYYALMSTMSKLSGISSPVYWDLFHVASGKAFSIDHSLS
ncbi:hypothetical protein IAU60_004080 [Kwoniella sp. DSM 27419]